MDFDNFIFIGNKIDDRIYEIPKKDLKWFIKVKKAILQNEQLRKQLPAIIKHLENLSVYQDKRVNEISLIPILNVLRGYDESN